MGERMVRVKRTYNLHPSTLRRVRELAEHYGAAPTQDGVVELAVERLYHEASARAEAERWSAAADDPAFKTEVSAIADVYDQPETWPK